MLWLFNAPNTPPFVPSTGAAAESGDLHEYEVLYFDLLKLANYTVEICLERTFGSEVISFARNFCDHVTKFCSNSRGLTVFS